MPVEMELSRIIISDLQEKQIIVLKEVDGERKFPIVIGINEAAAIDRRLKGIPMPRPMTHDLLADVIDKLGGTITKIEIHNLSHQTFFATLFIKQKGAKGKTVEVDSRPSDAIALGIATGVKIFVAEEVLQLAEFDN